MLSDDFFIGVKLTETTKVNKSMRVGLIKPEYRVKPLGQG